MGGSQKIAVLLSGGIDSTGCLAFFLEQNKVVEGVFIDYGQPAAETEFTAAKAVAKHYSIPLIRLAWTGTKRHAVGLIPGRNALLLIATLLEFGSEFGLIAIGIHNGTTYADCTPHFLEQMQVLFDMYMRGAVQIVAPFKSWTKSETIAYCISRFVPLDLTYSCELGGLIPCGKCLSCRDRENINAGA